MPTAALANRQLVQSNLAYAGCQTAAKRLWAVRDRMLARNRIGADAAHCTLRLAAGPIANPS